MTRKLMGPENGRPRRILVVDDEPMVASTVRLVLEMEGFEVCTVETAEEALAEFAPEKFDLVITDYKLPGMDGLRLAGQLRLTAERQPIILMSAYAESLRENGSLPRHVDALLGKPFSLDQLRGTLSKLLAGA